MHLRLPSLLTVHILVARLTLQSFAVPVVTQSDTNDGVAVGSAPAPSPKSDTAKEIAIGATSAAAAGIAGAIGATHFQRYKNAFRVIPSDAKHNVWGKAGAEEDGGVIKGPLTDQGFFVGPDRQVHTPDQFAAATQAAQADGVSTMKVIIGNRRVIVDLNKSKGKLGRDTRKLAENVQLYNDLAKYGLRFEVEGEWTKAFSTDEARKLVQRENNTGAESIKYVTGADPTVREMALGDGLAENLAKVLNRLHTKL